VLERNPREIKRRRNFGGVFISTTASLVVLIEAKDLCNSRAAQRNQHVA
jgi:hypothetical protein